MNANELPCDTCEAGLCSCAEEESEGRDVNKTGRNAAEKLLETARRDQWWLEHSRKQNARLWELLGGYLNEEDQAEILEQLGRNCAINFGKAQQYIGDPEGFFRFMFSHSGEMINYDRDSGIITVITRERDCDCRLVNSKNISPVYCSCSIGWQKQTYETILGKKVEVEVKEAVIRGAKRCAFEITVLEENMI